MEDGGTALEPPAVMNGRDVHAQLRELVAKLGYPYPSRETVVSQLYQACMTYFLKPVVARDPTPPKEPAPGFPPTPSPNIVCLEGALTITYQNRGYQTPINLFVVLAFPFVFPLVYVRPYPGAVLRPNHPFVNSETGYVDLASPRLPPGIWRPNENSISGILMRLQVGFSQAPPLQEDPQYAERRRHVATLTPMVQQRMQQETEDAKKEFVGLQNTLRTLRQNDVTMSLNIRKQAAEAGGGVGSKLAAVRESAMRLDAQTKEYGVDDGEDIDLDALLHLSADHPLREDRDRLEMEDKALDDALDAVSSALQENLISMDVFLKQTKALSAKQYHVRARMVKVGAEIAAMLEAQDAAGPSGQDGGGSGSGDGRTAAPQRSNFLMTGTFLASHVTRGPAHPPPAPGPPVRLPAGFR